MKKLISLLLVMAMVLSLGVLAFAEDKEEKEELELDPETVVEFDRESPVTDWVGEWVLVAAYIGEDFAEENEIETVGLVEVPEEAVTMTVEAILDGSATGSDAGVMVDQANYWHAHVYDMEATVRFAEDITDDEATLKLPWDGWIANPTGEGEGDFNKGVGKLSKVSAEDKSLYFTTVTGVESEEIDDENMKYVGMNKDGLLIVCYCEENLVKKDVEVSFGYIFAPVEAEEA